VLNHSEKTWKAYFLEFIMIFLAVMMGFFAENLREYISDRDQEKEYIVGLINNLQADTTELNAIIAENERNLKGLDTLLSIEKENFKMTTIQDSIFYYSVSYISNVQIFRYSDLTISQLRNAGGYSLIKVSSVADSIAEYESRNAFIKNQEKFYTEAYSKTWDSFGQVFDRSQTNEFARSYMRTHKIPTDLKLLITKDDEAIYHLYNDYWALSIAMGGYTTMLKNHHDYLSKLILFLKKNYRLD